VNTTSYGEEFEKQVFDFLNQMLAYDDVPGASAKRSKLFFKKNIPL
jgi:hypothetical protein